MKPLRLLSAAFAACLFTAAGLAADASGTWKWTVATNDFTVDTTLQVVAKAGVLTGTYSSSYGTGPISEGTVHGDAISFKVVREIQGGKYVLQYDGTIIGDTIKGAIQFPGFNGGDAQKLDWNAKRDPAATP